MPPLPVSVSSPAPSTAVFQACLQEAIARSRGLMERAILVVEASLPQRLGQLRQQAERQVVHHAILMLGKHRAILEAGFPIALRRETDAAHQESQVRAGGGTSNFMSFNDLALVDDTKAAEQVEVQRAQQIVQIAADPELVPFNALVCAALGMSSVRADANPLRPSAYVRALRRVIQDAPVDAMVRVRWLNMLGEAIAPLLAAHYRDLVTVLRAQGVSEAGFAIVPGSTALRGGAARAPAAPAASAAPAAMPPQPDLQVSALHQLLGIEPARPRGTQAPPPGTDFIQTVPQAVEALQQLQGVETTMHRLRARGADDPVHGLAQLPAAAGVARPGQAIALQVLNLMLENMAGDPRLLPAVRASLRALEPALQRVALADPRFFSDKTHPARRLLDEMTTRSLAWRAESEPGFDGFIGPLREAVQALVDTRVDGREPFEFALQTLADAWERGRTRERRQREKAMRALRAAEERNMAAVPIAQEIEARTDLKLAPPVVIAFLVGPWAQVCAQATLRAPADDLDPGDYKAVVPDLLWSVLPHTTAAAATRLARSLPALLAKLRQGLASIGYTQVQVRRFLDRLAVLHQDALKGLPAIAATPDARAQGVHELERLLGSSPMADDGWLAPAEARTTGFMDSVPNTDDKPLFMNTQPGTGPGPVEAVAVAQPGSAPVPAAQPGDLVLGPGSWIELREGDAWTRWQVWVSPHKTLLMLSGPGGKTHSMTPRLASAMAQEGVLRVVVGGAVVDGALDAIARGAG